MWIIIGLLGGYYWGNWQHIPAQPSPPWVKFVVAYGIMAFLPIGLATIVYLKGARLFASIYFLINSYFMLSMSLLSSMAVTGDWL
ncbi:MAG: hypothetical protein JWM36_4357 [Hyphomicrobiales bacterium]|nr:hypothetical protein [Hyphomicrobiales bacterium]